MDAPLEESYTNLKNYYSLDVKEIEAQIVDNEMKANVAHFKRGVPARIFDFTTYSLNRGGTLLFPFCLIGSALAFRKYNYTEFDSTKALASGVSTLFFFYKQIQIVLKKKMEVATMTISPSGSKVTFIMFNGSTIESDIKDI